jgi:hypothetical protein
MVINDADQLKIVATKSVGASPAPVDAELFIRGDVHLFCFANVHH